MTKNKQKEDIFELKDTAFSDKWSTYKYLTSIHSDIKKDITSDFILAKLNENQKESIIELVRDAYFIKKAMERLIDCKTYKVGKNHKYIKNNDGSFRKFDLSEDEKEYISNMAKLTFNAIMIKILMTKIEYRNVDSNVIMELITEKDKMVAENDRLEEENKDITERIKKNIKKGGNDGN